MAAIISLTDGNRLLAKWTGILLLDPWTNALFMEDVLDVAWHLTNY